MRCLIIYAHPNPKSFCHAIAETARETLAAQGAEVLLSDLYKQKFDPILSAEDFTRGHPAPEVVREQKLLLWAEKVIFIYPLWWFDRPAILKGYFDRVFSNGFAFTYGDKGAKGLLTHLSAAVFQTVGAPESLYAAQDALSLIQRPMTEGTLGFSGIQTTAFQSFFGVPSASIEQRQNMLEVVRKTLNPEQLQNI